MKKFLEYITTAIVNHPQDVTIAETVDEKQNLVNLELNVNAEDMGRIIGKQGKTIKAIRNLLHILGVKNGKRVKLNLVEKTPPESAAVSTPDQESQAARQAPQPSQPPTEVAPPPEPETETAASSQQTTDQEVPLATQES